MYRFAFPEQVFYPRTLQARTAATRFTLDPPWVTGLLAMLAKMKLLSYLRNASVRHASARLFEKLQSMYRGRKTYALVVAARGDQGVARLSIVGENESDGTALGAALMARKLYEGDIDQPGVWLPEQVITPGTFYDELAARNLFVQEYT